MAQDSSWAVFQAEVNHSAETIMFVLGSRIHPSLSLLPKVVADRVCPGFASFLQDAAGGGCCSETARARGREQVGHDPSKE